MTPLNTVYLVGFAIGFVAGGGLVFVVVGSINIKRSIRMESANHEAKFLKSLLAILGYKEETISRTVDTLIRLTSNKGDII